MLGNKCFVIAEAGVNHNGNIELALQLIDAAAEAGADAVKFQTFKTEKLVAKDAPTAEYQFRNTGSSNQHDMLRMLELSYEEHIILMNHCKTREIMFLSTPFDHDSAIMLNEMQLPMFKTGSGDLTNLSLLKQIAKFGKPMIVSTGMANLGEVEEAIHAIYDSGNNNITLLHCTSEYPAPFDDINLNAIKTLESAFKLTVGYSDHTEGIEIAIAAVAMGAHVIEKHFTLDKTMEGPDHKASLEPMELARMISCIRNVERAFGDGIKRCSPSEVDTRIAARKSMVASKNIIEGEVMDMNNICYKRPGNGLSPRLFELIEGRQASRNIKADEKITLDMVK